MSELDLTEYLRGTVQNLDWLNVNQQDYQKLDTLPKQNLDIIPDLQAAWSHSDQPASNFVPNTGAPKSMYEVGMKVDPALRPEMLRLTSRRAMMASRGDLNSFKALLTKAYTNETLQGARSILADTLSQRGLLGQWYIDASDFDKCHTGTRDPDFVAKFASKAPYVLAKAACDGCVHAAAGKCSVFHKQIVSEIPYSEGLAAQVEHNLSAQPREDLDPATRIKLANLSNKHVVKTASDYSGMPNVADKPQLIPASSLVRAKTASTVADPAIAKVVTAAQRELIKGRSAKETVEVLKKSFDMETLQSTKAHWGDLVTKEAGLFGVAYMPQEAFKDCAEGANFLSKHASKVRAIVASDKCESCLHNRSGSCGQYGRPLVASAEEAYTPEVVESVLWDYKMTGRVASNTQVSESDAKTALKALHKLASSAPVVATTSRMGYQTGFYGGSTRSDVSDRVQGQVLRTAARYLNEGLYGADLKEALSRTFTASEILSAKEKLASLLTEQGLQGIYYVDPSIYEDYGFGCREASKAHRSRGVPYVKAGSKCGSCVHQLQAGYCAQLNKPLVDEVPYENKTAQQRAVLASGKSASVDAKSIIHEAMAPFREFELKTAAEMPVDLTASAVAPMELDFNGQKV